MGLDHGPIPTVYYWIFIGTGGHGGLEFRDVRREMMAKRLAIDSTIFIIGVLIGYEILAHSNPLPLLLVLIVAGYAGFLSRAGC